MSSNDHSPKDQHVSSIFLDKSHWENKVNFMEHSKIFLDYFASDLIERSMDLYFSKKSPGNVKILDVATGTGLVPFKFVDEKLLGSEWNISLDGIDFAPSMIEGSQFKKQSRIEKQEVSFDWDKLTFQVMDGQDLKFSDESFDIVYSNMGVLFYPNITKGLTEIRRVLKSGGMAFVNAWTKDFPTRAQFHATFDVLKHGNRYALSVFSLQDPKVFEKYCKEAGFENVQIKQATQVLKIQFGEFKKIIRMGSQIEELIKKHLEENPQSTSTIQELLDQIDELVRKEFNVSSDQDECEIISIANVAILSK